jgi:hypothetical protein
MLTRPEAALGALGGPRRDLRDIMGQESAKRTLEVPAAGGPQPLHVANARPKLSRSDFVIVLMLVCCRRCAHHMWHSINHSCAL